MIPQVPAVVIVQTPQYGTIAWGPFASRADAHAFVDFGKYKHELLAAYENTEPDGMVVMVVSLYSTDLPNFPDPERN